MLLFNIRGAANTAFLDHQMSTDTHCNQGPKASNAPSNLIGRTTMNKIIISTLAAVIALSSLSPTFAAPKQKAQDQKVHEPIYFMLATGEL